MKTENAFVLCATRLIIVAVTTFSGPCLYSHNERLHEEMTDAAADASFFLRAYLAENLGYNYGDFHLVPSFTLPVPQGISEWSITGYSPMGWLRMGAYWEDMQKYGVLHHPARAVNHFYNPIPSPAAPLTDKDEPLEAVFPNNVSDSFTWATVRNVLGPTKGWWDVLLDVGPNTETWQNARDYQWAAISGSTAAARKENFAHAMYALGHVLHLQQDLSQPDHVRNDNHYLEAHRWIENFGADTYLNRPKNEAFPRDGSTPWELWRLAGFNKLRDFWDRDIYTGLTSQPLDSDAIFNSLSPESGGQRLGLAEFVNGNFLGEDSGYAEHYLVPDKHLFPFPRVASTSYPNFVKEQVILEDGYQTTRLYLDKIYDGRLVSPHSEVNYLGAVFDRKPAIGLPAALVATSITRGALSTSGPAKSNFLSVPSSGLRFRTFSPRATSSSAKTIFGRPSQPLISI